MRVTGGQASGIHLQSPRGRGTRPASDAMREALFSSLGAMTSGSRVLDLFAGTGAYGLEAVSRGAARVEWVEADARCIACIKENLKRVLNSCSEIDCATQVRRLDVFKRKREVSGEWDLVIADPPYQDIPSMEQRLFELADCSLRPAGLLVLEQPADLKITAAEWREVNRLGKKRGTGPSLSWWKRRQEVS